MQRGRKSKIRKYYLDNIRWAVVLLVVVYHVFYVFNACGVLGGIGSFSDVQYQDGLLYFVYPWFMVLLFLIAGMSARYALEKRTVKEFIGSRTVKLLVPSTLGLFVFQWILGFFNVYIGGGLDSIPNSFLIRYPVFVLSGTGPLWFAQMLWLYSLLLGLIKKIDKNDKLYNLCGKCPAPVLLLGFLPLWGGAQIGNVPVISVYRFGIYLVAFLFGYLFFSHEKAQQFLEKIHLFSLAAALALGVGYVIYYFGTNYTEDPCLRSFFTNIYAWAAVLAILGCGKAWFDKTSPFAAYMSRSSFGIYVLHYLFMVVSCWVMKNYTPLPAAVIYPLCIAAALGCSVGCYELFRRIPFIRYTVLGIKKKKA